MSASQDNFHHSAYFQRELPWLFGLLWSWIFFKDFLSISFMIALSIDINIDDIQNILVACTSSTWRDQLVWLFAYLATTLIILYIWVPAIEDMDHLLIRDNFKVLWMFDSVWFRIMDNLLIDYRQKLSSQLICLRCEVGPIEINHLKGKNNQFEINSIFNHLWP